MKALPLLFEKLRRREYKSSSVQLAHMTNRMFTTLESKGILRTALEEYMLAAMHKAGDPLAAEFIHTFRHEHFNGRHLILRYEHIRDNISKQSVSILMPKTLARRETTDFPSLYGFRPSHPNVFSYRHGNSASGSNPLVCNRLVVLTSCQDGCHQARTRGSKENGRSSDLWMIISGTTTL